MRLHITLSIAALIGSVAIAQAQDSDLTEPSFRLILGDEHYIATYATGEGVMQPGNLYIGREYFDEQTSAMLLPADGVAVEGYVAAGYKTQTGIGNRDFYPNLMIGNDSEAGEITFNFNDDFVKAHNGLPISAVVLKDCVQGYSETGCDITVNGLSHTIATPFVWDDERFEFEGAPVTDHITISTAAGKGVGCDEIWVYLSTDHPTSATTIVENPASEATYYHIDGTLAAPTAKGLLIRLSAGQPTKIYR